MTLDEFFSGYEASRPLFEALRELVESLGPAETVVSKSQIAFTHGRAFARAWVPGRYLKRGDVPLVGPPVDPRCMGNGAGCASGHLGHVERELLDGESQLPHQRSAQPLDVLTDVLGQVTDARLVAGHARGLVPGFLAAGHSAGGT